MKTKEECLAFLAGIEKDIEEHNWETQVHEPSELLSHNDMDEILPHFKLPQPEYVDGSCVHLPADWLPDEDIETSKDYREVAEKFFDIYSTLRYEVSREAEGLELEYAQDLRDMEREYYRSVM